MILTKNKRRNNAMSIYEPTGTEEDYEKFLNFFEYLHSSDFSKEEKIQKLIQLKWALREKFEVVIPEETELTDRALKLYKEVDSLISEIQKENKNKKTRL